MIAFTPWPEDLAKLYRSKGYWIGKPLTHGVEAQARQRPDAPAVICGDRRLSYGALDGMATALAARLARAGLGHGDTALVQLPNRAEFYVTLLALLKIGVVPVNALYSHRGLEMREYARQIDPRLLVGCRNHELFRDDALIDELRAGDGLSQVLLLGEGDPARSLEDWMAPGPVLPPDARPTPAGEVAFFQLSGGSTGTPKLIPRTHDDYDYSVRASVGICRFGPGTRFLCALPAAHNFPLSSPGALGVFHAGGCVVMAPGPDPQSCFDLVARHGVNTAALVPSAVSLWLKAVELDQGPRPAALETLELLLVGGAAFGEAMARRVPQVLGCRLQQVFGMAEGLVNYTRPDDPDAVVFTTQGRPISPDDEIRILDPEGRPVPEGQVGMLATRGPYTFRGYYRAPEHNAQAFDSDGFYRSGDLVRRLACGNLQVVGRLKDQINRGGEKIAAEEIENLLTGHPQVTHAALIAVSDEHLGEKSCAILVTRADADARPTPPALRRWLLERGVAEYKLPDRFRFIADMPLTAVGKIDKRKLRETVAA